MTVLLPKLPLCHNLLYFHHDIINRKLFSIFSKHDFWTLSNVILILILCLVLVLFVHFHFSRSIRKMYFIFKKSGILASSESAYAINGLKHRIGHITDEPF